MNPNIIFVLSDDHAAHALSCYGSRINKTPNLDRVAVEGIRFDQCYCTNSICTPSRASILTGLYNHQNGVRTLFDTFDGRQQTFPKLLRSSGYQTALFGKWHLGHGGDADPTGFDYWAVLPGQGVYFDPILYEFGEERHYAGYVTDLLTDMALDWLVRRDDKRPFLLCLHHKAPHRPWEPNPKFANLYEADRLEPPTFWDDYATRSHAAREALMRMEHLTPTDLKVPIPAGLKRGEEKQWRYQRYIKDYLRCIASVDESMGRVLDWVDTEGLIDDTVVVYTSDQGFFLGDHGWFDKRFMYEQSLRMPLMVRYPRLIEAGRSSSAMVLNIDLAPTLCELAGAEVPEPMSGRSLDQLFSGDAPAGWRRSMYYRYWEHNSGDHRVPAHYGLRTERYKLIYYYGRGLGATGASSVDTPPEWELFDLDIDPTEMRNVYGEPGYMQVTAELSGELAAIQNQVGDDPDGCP